MAELKILNTTIEDFMQDPSHESNGPTESLILVRNIHAFNIVFREIRKAMRH